MKSNDILAWALTLCVAPGLIACGTNSPGGEAVEADAAEGSALTLALSTTELDVDPDTVLGLDEGCPYTWDSVRVVYPGVATDKPDTVWVGIELGYAEAALGYDSIGKTAVHNVPEYHDCQRFITDPPAYDSLFSIFATQPETLWARLDSAKRPVLAAQIWTPAGDYTPLGLRSGFNCLFLQDTGAGLKASMRHSGPHVDGCKGLPDIDVESPQVKKLKVVETTYPEAVVPPAARWELENPSSPVFRIGLRCKDDTWCEIMPPGSAPDSVKSLAQRAYDDQAAIGSVAPWTGAQLDRARIKGWYDEQILDIVVNGELVSSGLRGYAVPDVGIEAHQDLSQYGTFVVSAYVYLEELDDVHESAYDKYLEKMNFGRTTWNQPNIIKICKRDGDEDGGDCGVDPDLLPSCNADPPLEDLVAEITNAESGKPAYFCVARCDHSSTLVPATARWRGVENDAKLWMRCAQGCCTVQ